MATTAPLTYDEIIRASFCAGIGAEIRHPRGRVRRRDAADRRAATLTFFRSVGYGLHSRR